MGTKLDVLERIATALETMAEHSKKSANELENINSNLIDIAEYMENSKTQIFEVQQRLSDMKYSTVQIVDNTHIMANEARRSNDNAHILMGNALDMQSKHNEFIEKWVTDGSKKMVASEIKKINDELKRAHASLGVKIRQAKLEISHEKTKALTIAQTQIKGKKLKFKTRT